MKIEYSSAIEGLLNNIYNHSYDMRDAFHRYLKNNPMIVSVEWDDVLEVHACEEGIVLGADAQAAGEGKIIKANHKGFSSSFFFRGNEEEIIKQLNKILFSVN